MAAATRLRAMAASRYAVWIGLALVLAAAAGLRGGAATRTEVVRPLTADAADYFFYAYNLKKYGIYARRMPTDQAVAPAPDALRPPGYPLFIAALTEQPRTPGTPVEVGASQRRIQLAQALIGVAVTALAFLLARCIVGPWWGLLAAAFTAASPHLVNIGLYFLTETLFSLTLVALLAVLCVRDLERRFGWLLAAGMLAGAAALVRPTANYLPLLLPPLFLWRWPRTPAFRASAAFVLGFALLYAPWAARNATLPGGADDQLMINMLHHGMYPDFAYEGDPASVGRPYRFDPRSKEIAASLPAVTAEIARRFAEDPWRHLQWYLVGKPVALWSWNEIQGAGPYFIYQVAGSPYDDSPPFIATDRAMRALHLVTVLLAMLFCVAVWFPRAHAMLPPAAILPAQACALLLIYVTALHMIGFPLPRYATPFRPELFVAAVGGLSLFVRFARARGAVTA